MNKKLIKQVAKVTGKKRAIHELSLAAKYTHFANTDRILSAFDWMHTPQGRDFWQDIYESEWPYTYKSNNLEI